MTLKTIKEIESEIEHAKGIGIKWRVLEGELKALEEVLKVIDEMKGMSDEANGEWILKEELKARINGK